MASLGKPVYIGTATTTSIPPGGTSEQASSAGTPITTATTVQMLAAQAGQSHYFWVSFSNSATTASVVQILDGATVIFEMDAAGSGGGFADNCAVSLFGSTGNAISIRTLTGGCSITWNVRGWYL